MELIWAILKIFQYLIVGPVFWLTDRVAGMIYPFEGDNGHDLLSLFLAMLIFAALTFGCIFLF